MASREGHSLYSFVSGPGQARPTGKQLEENNLILKVDKEKGGDGEVPVIGGWKGVKLEGDSPRLGRKWRPTVSHAESQGQPLERRGRTSRRQLQEPLGGFF